jgi:hypothetical protein
MQNNKIALLLDMIKPLVIFPTTYTGNYTYEIIEAIRVKMELLNMLHFVNTSIKTVLLRYLEVKYCNLVKLNAIPH